MVDGYSTTGLFKELERFWIERVGIPKTLLLHFTVYSP